MLRRGPQLLALEGVDAGELALAQLFLPPGTPLRAETRPIVLGEGVPARQGAFVCALTEEARARWKTPTRLVDLPATIAFVPWAACGLRGGRGLRLEIPEGPSAGVAAPPATPAVLERLEAEARPKPGWPEGPGKGPETGPEKGKD